MLRCEAMITFRAICIKSLYLILLYYADNYHEIELVSKH